jgi:hypothetical protein
LNAQQPLGVLLERLLAEKLNIGSTILILRRRLSAVSKEVPVRVGAASPFETDCSRNPPQGEA